MCVSNGEEPEAGTFKRRCRRYREELRRATYVQLEGSRDGKGQARSFIKKNQNNGIW